MGRLPSELTSGGYLSPAFLSPDFPSREAMKLRKLSFVKTNFRTRSVHFNTVFIAVRLKCSVAKVRSGGKAVAAMCGCVLMSAVFVRLCQPLPMEGLDAKRSVLCGSVEAGTLLYPFLRLDDAVAVQVGAEVTMPADGALGIQHKQLADEGAQRCTLLRRAGIGGSPVGLQAALVGNADAAGIEAPHMGADIIEGAHGEDDTFTGDVEVIAAAFETSLAVDAVEAFRSKLAVAPGSGAMHYDKVDAAVAVQDEYRQIGGRHRTEGGRNGLGNGNGLWHK